MHTLQISYRPQTQDSVLLKKFELEQIGMDYGRLLFGLRDLCERKPEKRPGEVWVQLCTDHAAMLLLRERMPDITALYDFLDSFNSNKTAHKKEKRNMKNNRTEFSRLCQALIEPLQAILDHPLMPEDAARNITDAFLEAADDLRPSLSNSGIVTKALKEMAKSSGEYEPSEETGDGEDNTPPAWIPQLSAAIAEALEDARLSEKAEDAITTLLTDLDNDYCHDFPTMAKTTLPVSLYRACGFEPPAPKRPVSASRQLSRLLADESLPEEIRDAIFDAVENIMNDLNRGKEMTLAWVKLYLDEAIKRREEKSAEE